MNRIANASHFYLVSLPLYLAGISALLKVRDKRWRPRRTMTLTIGELPWWSLAMTSSLDVKIHTYLEAVTRWRKSPEFRCSAQVKPDGADLGLRQGLNSRKMVVQQLWGHGPQTMFGGEKKIQKMKLFFDTPLLSSLWRIIWALILNVIFFLV